MRKKITSLSVLLLTGALVLTSCVKSEEDDSTKALRTAQEQRALEKLSEDKQLKVAELATKLATEGIDLEKARAEFEKYKLQYEREKELAALNHETNKANAEKSKDEAQYGKTLVKVERLLNLLDRKAVLLGEINDAEKLLKETQDTKADKEATVASLQSKLDLLKEKLDRELASIDRSIALKEHERQTVEAADLTDPTELKKQKTTKEYAKTVENQKKAPLEKAYKDTDAAVIKNFTDGVLATDFAKVLYKNEGNNRYSEITSPDATPYVVNFTHIGDLDYSNTTTDGIRYRDLDFITDDNDVAKPVVDGITYTYGIAKKQVAVQKLDELQAQILRASVDAPDYAPYDTAIQNAQTNVNDAQTTYNADPSYINRMALANAKSALQAAKDAKKAAQDGYNTAMETANKLKAVQRAITGEGNLAKINKVITDYNAALPNIAKDYAAWQKVVKKVQELDAEITALNALIGGNEPKADIIKGIEDAITDFKLQKRAAQAAYDATHTNDGEVTNVKRLIEQKQALIEYYTKTVELKKAKLQKVEAQIAAVNAE